LKRKGEEQSLTRSEKLQKEGREGMSRQLSEVLLRTGSFTKTIGKELLLGENSDLFYIESRRLVCSDGSSKKARRGRGSQKHSLPAGISGGVRKLAFLFT